MSLPIPSLLLAIALGMLSTACEPAPARIELTPLAVGEWVVVTDGVLMRTRSGTDGTRGRIQDAPAFAVLRDTLRPVTPEMLSLRAGSATIDVVRIAGIYLSTTSSPRLVRSPTQLNRYVFEHSDALWLFAAPDTVIRLTTDDDVIELRGKQREGEVILYWSTEPVWSADGRYIAFVSNRESVRSGGAGQSIWLIDTATREQRPLLAIPGVSLRTEGVLDERFLYSSSRDTGVLAVHPQAGEISTLGGGYVLAAHERGHAAAVSSTTEGIATVVVHSQSKTRALPAPDSGFTWSTNARFSPSGHRLAILATDGAGRYRLFVFDGKRGPLSADIPGGPSYGPVWIDENALVFASAGPREPLRTWVARVR